MAGEMITSLKALLSPQMAKYVGSSCSQQLRGHGGGREVEGGWQPGLDHQALALFFASAEVGALGGPMPRLASRLVSLAPDSCLTLSPHPHPNPSLARNIYFRQSPGKADLEP